MHSAVSNFFLQSGKKQAITDTLAKDRALNKDENYQQPQEICLKADFVTKIQIKTRSSVSTDGVIPIFVFKWYA